MNDEKYDTMDLYSNGSPLKKINFKLKKIKIYFFINNKIKNNY